MEKINKSDDFSVIAGTDSDKYLGSPKVVQLLVNGFCEQVYEWIKARGQGEMSKDEFSAKLRDFVRVFGDIFMGRNENYVKQIGWNSRSGVGIALRQSLGEFWNRYKDEYDNDPGKAAFGWLAASLADAALLSMTDPDKAGVMIRLRKEQLIRTLLGVHRRA